MSISREVRNLRRDSLKAYKRVGSKFLVRRAINIRNIESGTASRCPKCYVRGYSNTTDPECPVCFGTGFDMGYTPAELCWGALDYSQTIQDEKMTTHGIEDSINSSFKIAVPPFVHDGDLIAQVVSDEPFKIDTPMEIDGVINQNVVFGWLSNNRGGTIEQENNIVGQSGRLVPLQPNDIRLSREFWEYNGEFPEVTAQKTKRVLS